MFSGIVEEVGRVMSVAPHGEVMRLTLDAPTVASDTNVSDSVCVNGVCLTVVAKDAYCLSFDCVPETLSRSSLGALKAGSPVNLERSLAVGQRLGGHFVQGHVDATAEVLAVENLGESWEMAFEGPEDLAPFMVEKGSVSLDGISLTLAAVQGRRFKVAIIPFTHDHTNFGELNAGDRVNVEVDILGKHVLKALAYLQAGGRISETLLGV